MDRLQPRDAASNDEAARPPASRRKEAAWQNEQDKALRQSDEQFRLLVEAVAEYAIFMLDLEGRVVSWNAGAARIKGYRAEEILGRHFSHFYTREAAEAGVPASALEAAAREGQWTGEGWRVRKDGTRFWAHVTITALYREDGALHGFAKVTRDMTGRREREKALRESEAKFRVLTENALVGVALFQRGVYRYVNPAFASITGYGPGELIGQSPEMLFHPGDWPHVQQQIKNRFAGKAKEAHYEARIVTKSGEGRRLEIFGSLIDYRGEPTLIATAVDITERRQLQREVLRVQETERRRLGQDLHDGVASQLTGVGVMLSTLSHRAAEQDEELAAQIEETQELIQESARNVRRLSRGLAPTGLSGKEFPAVLERLADNVEGGCFERDVENLSELSDDTAAHLYWIAQEAVANAQRYAEASRVVIRLTRSKSSPLVLEVEDDGQGFDAEEVEAGSLGLRTMRYRADLLGAAFSVDSSPGEGTRVWCRLRV